MSSQEECLSQRTAFYTAGSHKPIEVKQESLARVVQLMGAVNEESRDNNSNENNNSSEYGNEFDGDEVDDDLVFSTVPQRSTVSTTGNIHFDEIDDEEMRRFAETLEQEQQQDTKTDETDPIDDDADSDGDQLCEDYARKMQTPTKSVQIQNKKRKERCIEDLDELLNDDNSDEHSNENQTGPQQTSPVFKRKP